MHVISRKRLREFWVRHPDAQGALAGWFRVTGRAEWRNPAELRRVYPHADSVGDCTVFNVRGNNYRLVTKIYYGHQTVLVRAVLTHEEYDEGKWKNDCNS